MTRIKPGLFIALMTLPLLIVLGCDGGTGSDGDGGSGTGRDLAWGLEKADPIRDAELPDGALHTIYAYLLDDDGELLDRAAAFWHFVYVDPAIPTDDNRLDVTVYTNGLTSESMERSELDEELPDYADADGWIDAADAGLPDGYDIDERLLLVVPNYLADWFGGSENLAYVLYYDADAESYDYLAAVDADTETLNNIFDGAQLQLLLDLLEQWIPDEG